MICRVSLQRESFFEPGLELRIFGFDRDRHDADRGAAIDLFEPVDDGAEKFFPFGRVVHVVDGKNDGCLDAWFSDPLGCGQLWKVATDVEWIRFVEVSEAIRVVARGRRLSECHEKKEKQKGRRATHLEHCRKIVWLEDDGEGFWGGLIDA